MGHTQMSVHKGLRLTLIERISWGHTCLARVAYTRMWRVRGTRGAHRARVVRVCVLCLSQYFLEYWFWAFT